MILLKTGKKKETVDPAGLDKTEECRYGDL